MQLAFLNTNLSLEIKRKSEKLMRSYKNLEAIIESKKLDLEPKLTVNYQASETQRGNQFSSQTENLALTQIDIEEYVITKRKLDLIYNSLKPTQKRIWDERYLLDATDLDVYLNMDIPDRTYYRLKREMISIVADAFGML